MADDLDQETEMSAETAESILARKSCFVFNYATVETTNPRDQVK